MVYGFRTYICILYSLGDHVTDVCYYYHICKAADSMATSHECQCIKYMTWGTISNLEQSSRSRNRGDTWSQCKELLAWSVGRMWWWFITILNCYMISKSLLQGRTLPRIINLQDNPPSQTSSFRLWSCCWKWPHSGWCTDWLWKLE